jgi:glycyl-tRNA synthetase
VPALLDRLRLGHGGVRVEGTPRRLAVIVHELAPRQSNSEEKVRGPPAKVSPLCFQPQLLGLFPIWYF